MTDNATPSPAQLARTYARCFATPDGARVLAHLQRTTLGRALGADASDAQLRHLEGQRQLINGILGRIARGQDGHSEQEEFAINPQHAEVFE